MFLKYKISLLMTSSPIFLYKFTHYPTLFILTVPSFLVIVFTKLTVFNLNRLNFKNVTFWKCVVKGVGETDNS